MNCFPSRMQYYRLLLLLLLKMPSLPPPRRVALCGEERPPGPFPPGPFPPQPRRSGGGRFVRRTHGGTAGRGWAIPFPFPLLTPRTTPGCPRGLSLRPRWGGRLVWGGWGRWSVPRWGSPGLSSALGAPLLLHFPHRGWALTTLLVSRPLQPVGYAACGSGADLLT